MTFGATYTVGLAAGLKDTSGNTLTPFTSTFTVQLGGTLGVTLTPPSLNVGQNGYVASGVA